MITLYYSPHATSVDNEAGRASGHADVPLAPIGEAQARQLGRHYASYAIDAVVASDLQRAATTAALAFGGRGIPIRLDRRLRECDYGEMTQCPPARLAELQHITTPYPGGENWLMAAQRVGACLRDLFPAYEGETVVIIGHKATKYGIEYWSGDAPFETIIRKQWEWREVPIWRYDLHAATLDPGNPDRQDRR